MAFASSRIGAQEAIIKPCDLCEDDENVNWFCKDCVQNLCERCKKIHLKTVSCKHHVVVSISEGVIITKKNVSNLCQEHGVQFSFFCRTCDKNICSKCLSLKHREHNFVEISELKAELHRKLNEALMEKGWQKEKITWNINSFEKYEKDCEKTLTQNYEFVDEWEKALCKDANLYAENAKKSMESASKQRMKQSKECTKKLEANKIMFEKEIENIRHESTFQTTETLNEFVKKSISKLQHLKPMSLSLPLSTSKITAESFEEDFIKYLTCKAERKQEESRKPGNKKLGKISVLQKLQIVKILHLNLGQRGHCMCRSPDGTLWIRCVDKVHQVDCDGSVIISMACFNDHSKTYMACLQEGDAIVSCVQTIMSCEVYKFTSDGGRVLIGRIGHTYNICVTENDEIVVGCGKRFEDDPISSIAIYSNEGKQLKEIELLKYTDAQCFCIDNDGNFITSDGNVLTFYDRKGSVLKQIKRKKSFGSGMMCDRHGNILGVGDNEKQVHLISTDGKTERTFEVDCDKCVDSIFIDNDDVLLILVDGNKVIFANYLK